MTKFPHQGDIVICDAEPNAGHEISGHDPSNGNIRRPFLVLSNYLFNQKTGMVHLMAITHTHKESPYRLPIVDFETKINGDVLLFSTPEYSFQARNGKIIGHLADKKLFDKILSIYLQSF